MTETPKSDFTIREAAKLSGMTIAMVDYLCRQGVMEPSKSLQRGRGRARQYSFGDVVMLRALQTLLSAGVSVYRMRVALRALRKYHKEISPTSLPARYLVTDGTKVFLRSKNDILDLDGSRQLSFLFVLELNEMRQHVIKKANLG